MTEPTASPETGLTRRQVTTALGWAAPVLAVAVAAPAAQASPAPSPGFEGLTGTWSTPVSRFGRSEMTFTVVNTGTQPYPLMSIRVDRRSGGDYPERASRIVTSISHELFYSGDNVLDAGAAGSGSSPAVPFAFALLRDFIAIEMAPGDAVQFGVVAADDPFDLVLAPGMNPDYTSVTAPCDFPTLTLPAS